jgi:hypothetical protein
VQVSHGPPPPPPLPLPPPAPVPPFPTPLEDFRFLDGRLFDGFTVFLRGGKSHGSLPVVAEFG